MQKHKSSHGQGDNFDGKDDMCLNLGLERSLNNFTVYLILFFSEKKIDSG